ncbi:MAG TPA: hypothetical protein DD381_04790 [Lentisphaeria bacterium]|nr:MAG: hypothetical protein A2X47_01700 [Lentisphaerae bacterium GWF2_38_69]HBM15648.1 hypothetical protein [Lentisphaeria bacterium]
MKNLILITGNDELSIKREALAVSSSLKESLVDSSSFETIDASSEGKKISEAVGAFLDSVNTPSFFSDSRVIFFKNVPFEMLLESEKKPKDNSTLKDILLETFKRELTNENLRILVSGPGLQKKSALYKFFKDNCQLIELNEISSTDVDFQANQTLKIREFFRKENKRIDRDAVEYIINASGSNSGRLSAELEKVSAYTEGKQTVEVEDCKAICSKTYEMAVWAYSEAIASKNLREALYSLNILIENPQPKDKSSPELPLLYTAVRKFKEILNMKATAQKLGIRGIQNYNTFKAKIESVDKSLLPGSIASIHPYKAFKSYEQSIKFKEKELAEIFSALLDANIELVSGNQTLRLVLENLTSLICSKQTNTYI